MSFANLPENVYDHKISLKGAKIQQKSMDDIIKDLELQDPNKDKYKTNKITTLFNTKQFNKGKKMIVIAFENWIFPLPRQKRSAVDDWKEDGTDSF